MDMDSVLYAINRMKKMPNNAASSAEAAAASAAAAQQSADAVDVATVAEVIAYMDFDGSASPAAVVQVSGSNPTIQAAKNTMYICGTLQTLSFTPNPSGISAVRFTSGSTATVLTVPNTVKWPDWFNGTLEANRVYEINIMDGIYGVVMSWA